MFKIVIASIVASLAAALLPCAAFAQGNEAACAVYASRAVQQYQSMIATPACRVPDDLRWQNNYLNHYNGCMAVPQIIVPETAARDAHLLSCSAQTAPAAQPSIVGNWTDYSGNTGTWQIQVGAMPQDLVAFVPGRTGAIPGRVISPTQIFINFALVGLPGCCTATLSADGQSLIWSNGAVWRR